QNRGNSPSPPRRELRLEPAGATKRLYFRTLLGQAVNRAIAEEFAISIFKIDPDHGHANFVPFWREALAALDEMPKTVRGTSRAFLHHSAVSRRRIAKQEDYFPIDSDERVQLLERAIGDIQYALDFIPATPEGESDLNLYNSLAHAYQDLADEEVKRGASEVRIIALRNKAHDATQRAYRANPDNSFVVETYARSLISDAKMLPEKAGGNAIEVLNIVYAAMDRDRSGQRRFALAKLADSAIGILLNLELDSHLRKDPSSEVDALILAIVALARDVRRTEGMGLGDFPSGNRIQAAKLLSHPLLHGNPQAVRLRYSLTVLDESYNFESQLELLQALQDGATVFSPQMRLEFALLLQQCGRHHEAERLFRELRRLWKEGDHYVEVPDRLRWLLTPDRMSRRQVTARIVAGDESRRIAKIRELQDTKVPFRPQEFSRQSFAPGSVIRGYISFGHNGPLLRPITAVQS
ncbi:hypothetical protein SAMN06265365_1762, partial [Tistlia consotensis]